MISYCHCQVKLYAKDLYESSDIKQSFRNIIRNVILLIAYA